MICFAICTVPAAPLRKEPSHRSEMTSQLLFGEAMEVIEEKEEWRLVRNKADGYEGWLTHHLVEVVEEAIAAKPSDHYAAGLLNPLHYCGQLMHLPMGSVLHGFEENRKTLWRDDLLFHGEWVRKEMSFQTDRIISTAMGWLNAPYLWGGKTLMGVDCSGFVQTVFRANGVQLLRDAYQQAEQGRRVDFLAQAEKGDVAFFHNEKGRVTHVGILINATTIIHAAGKVRIDPIDAIGIVHGKTGARTHQLHSIRRYS